MSKNKKIIKTLTILSLLTLSISTNAMQKKDNLDEKIKNLYKETSNQENKNEEEKKLNKSYDEKTNNKFEKIESFKKQNETFDKKFKNKIFSEEPLNKINEPKEKFNIQIKQENKKPKKINKDYLFKVDNVFKKVENFKKYNKTPIKKTIDLKKINNLIKDKTDMYKDHFLKILKQVKNLKSENFEKNFATLASTYENILKNYKNNFQDSYKTNQEIKNIILKLEKQFFLKIQEEIEELNTNLIFFPEFIYFPEKEKEFEDNYQKIMLQYVNRLKEYKKNVSDDRETMEEIKNIILKIENNFKNYQFNVRKNITKSLKDNLEKNILKKDFLDEKEKVFNECNEKQYKNTIETLNHIIKESEILKKELGKKDLTNENIDEKIKQYYEAREKIKNFEFYNETINYLYDIIEHQFSCYKENELEENFNNSYSKTMIAKYEMQELENAIFEIVEKNNIPHNEKINDLIKINPKIAYSLDYEVIKQAYTELKDFLAKKNINIDKFNKKELKQEVSIYKKYLNETKYDLMSIYKKYLNETKYNVIIKYIDNIEENEKILENINKILPDIEKQISTENIDDVELMLNILKNKIKKIKKIVDNYPDDIIYSKEIKNYAQETKDKINSLFQSIEVTRLKANLKKDKNKEKDKDKTNILKQELIPEQLIFFQERNEHLIEKTLIENDLLNYYRGKILGYKEKIDKYLKNFDLLELKKFKPASTLETENYDEQKLQILKTKLNLINDHFKKNMFNLNKKLNEKNFSIRDFTTDKYLKFSDEYKNLNLKIGFILNNIKNYLESNSK